MLATLSRHRVFTLYCASLAWLTLATLSHALWNGRGLGHAPFVALLLAGTVLAYVVSWQLLDRMRPALTRWRSEVRTPAGRLARWQIGLLWTLVAALVAVAINHMVLLNQIPLVAAWQTQNEMQSTLIRQQAYADLPRGMRYLSDYSFKALAPTLLLITAFYRLRLFWLVLLIACLYTLAMFARVLPIILLLPLLTYLLMQRRWCALALTAALLAVMLAIVTAAASPSIRASFGAAAPSAPPVIGQTAPDQPDLMQRLRTDSVLYAMGKRALYIPGQVIDQWFAFYATPAVREQGCGYRRVARWLDCPYVPIPTKLYQVYYPDNVQQGMKGSLNAASFMIDYANFGPTGTALGALFVALLFCLITLIYRDHPLALPMNLPLVLATMETGVLTALNSGAGWLVMTALFLLFFRLQK